MSWDKLTAGVLIEVQEVGTKLFGGGALNSKEKEGERGGHDEMYYKVNNVEGRVTS